MDLQGVFKRRRWVVKSGLQFSAVFYLFFVTLAIVAFHTWLTYFRVSKVAKVAGDTPLASMFAQDVLVTVCFMAVFAFFTGILGSHKVAGPLYRFEQVLKKVQKGDISEQIQLRRGDMLLDFAGELNLALANLRELAAEDRLAVQEAARLIADVRGRTGVAEIQSKLDAAAELLAKVGSKLVLEPEWRRQAGRSAERALDLRAALALPAAPAVPVAHVAAPGQYAPAHGPVAHAAPMPPMPAPAPAPVVVRGPGSTVALPPRAGAGGWQPPSPAGAGGAARPTWIADRTLPGAAPAPGAGLVDGRPQIPAHLQVAKTVHDPVKPPKM